MEKKPTKYNSFKDMGALKQNFKEEIKLVPIKSKKTENKGDFKNKEHRLDPVFKSLNEHELFRKRYFEYLQMANNAFATVFYTFANKRKSKPASTIKLKNSLLLAVEYINSKNVSKTSTRDVNKYLLLHLYEQNKKRAKFPLDRKKQLEKVKEYGAQLKFGSLDFFINDNFYLLKDLPLHKKQEFINIYNETFYTDYILNSENSSEKGDGLDIIIASLGLLKIKRDSLEHYPEGKEVFNEFGLIVKLFNYLQLKQANEFAQFMISIARKIGIEENSLIDLSSSLDAELKKLNEQKNGQKLFLYSRKLKMQREVLVNKAHLIKANTNITEAERKKQLAQLHAQFTVHKTKRQATHQKFEKLKKVKEELFEPYQDKKRDKKLLELMNYIGKANFLKMKNLFISKGLQPGFNDISDLYECSNNINTILGSYFTKLQDKLPKIQNDRFAFRIKEWCLKSQIDSKAFNELIYLRNEIKHNTNCFMIAKTNIKSHCCPTKLCTKFLKHYGA